MNKKTSCIKQKCRFFISNNWKNITIIASVLIILITFFLLTIFIVDTNTTINETFKLNYKRSLQMIISGFNLGICSYLLQRSTKNRLTDCAVMGFGSINLIPLVILASCTNFSLGGTGFNQTTFYNILPIAFIITSILLSLMFHFFSVNKNKTNYSKILISGIILNFICIAIALSIKPTLNYLAAPQVNKYIMGFVNNDINTYKLLFCGLISIIALLWIIFITPKLRILIINQDLGIKLGINNNMIFLQMFIAIGMLVGSSYALTGDFVFVGFLAGNIAYIIFKNKLLNGVLTSGLMGAIIILITYFILDNLIDVNYEIIPQLIPLIISPYFLFLLLRNKNV